MQQKNFVLFMVLALAILMGWMWVQNQIWPPAKPRPKDQDAVAQNDPKQKESKAKEPEKKDDEPKKKDDEPKAKEQPKQAAKKERPPARTFTLGDETSFIRAKLTDRGAGVTQLVLNKFEASNRLGEPTGKELELIQEDPYFPSYLLYHFPAAGADHPLLALGEEIWKVEDTEGPEGALRAVRFSVRVPEPYEYLTIVKAYRLDPKEYHIELTLEVRDGRAKDDKRKAAPFRYQLAGAHGLPIEGEWYTGTFRNAAIGTVDSSGYVWRDLEDALRIAHREGGEAVPPGNRGDLLVRYAAVMNQFFAAAVVVSDRQESGESARDVLAWARPTLETAERRGRLMDVGADRIVVAGERGVDQEYLLLPRTRSQMQTEKVAVGDLVIVHFYETSDGRRVATWVRAGRASHPQLSDVTVRVNSEEISLRPGETKVHKYLLYHGPVKVRLLNQFTGDKAVDPELVERYADALGLRTLTDYRSAGPFGYVAQKIMFTDLLIAITGLMHWLLYWLHWITFGNWGVAIILLTVIVRGMLFPISRRQAQVAAKMQALAPELKKVQEKFKNDPQARTHAVMDLYRKHNVHPLGMCLPLVLQLPFFLGLYYALGESIHFRLAGFLWMDNLAAPDMLFWWTERIPWVSDPDSMGGFFYLGPYFNLLPVLAVVLMIVQQKLLTPPPTDEQQAFQQKLMKYMMVFFGLLFYKVAAGLCIYFIVSSLWGVAERKLLPKKPTGPAAPGPGSGGQAAKLTPRTKPKPGPKKDGNGAVQRVKDWWADVLKQAKKK